MYAISHFKRKLTQATTWHLHFQKLFVSSAASVVKSHQSQGGEERPNPTNNPTTEREGLIPAGAWGERAGNQVLSI